MPRKKLVPEVSPLSSVEPTAKPQKPSALKKTVKPVTEPKATLTKRAPSDQTAALSRQAELEPPVSVSPEKQKRPAGRNSSRSKSVVSTPAPIRAESVGLDHEHDEIPILEFRPKRGSAKVSAPPQAIKKSPKPSLPNIKPPAKKRAPIQSTLSQVRDDGEDDGLVISIWRSKAGAAPKVPHPVEETGVNPKDGKRGRRVRKGRGDSSDDVGASTAAPSVAVALTATVHSLRPAVVVSLDEDQDDALQFSFRSKGGERVPAPVQESRPRERERERKQVRERQPRPAPEPVVTPREVVPVVEIKPLIAIPEDAPRVVVRSGIPTLVRDHKVIPPIMFFGGGTDERKLTQVMDEVKMASEAGIHLHSVYIDFEVDSAELAHSIAAAGFLLRAIIKIDPEAQVLFRLAFNAPRGWQEKFPKATYRHADGSYAEPSVCDDDFWGLAEELLVAWIDRIRQFDENPHILGIHIERGEWFFGEGWGYDTSKAAEQKFREWARIRYSEDEVTLRASWFDGSSNFETISIPPYDPLGAEGERFIRSSRRQRRYVDYHLFLSDATVHRIGELAYAAKKASDGYFIIGASYGYTFEWSHPESGHLSLGKLLRNPEIDFIAGPPSYRNREPGESSPFPCPIDSIALNGKLYLSEEDYKTSLTIESEPDTFNPQLRTPQSLESVHWRGAGAAFAHGSGVAWMDLWGNGWLKTASVWTRAERVRQALVARMAAPLGDPEVAVFIDERALAYLVDSNAFKLLVQNVRESVLRAGVSAGFYLLSDLAHRDKFPDSKLYIFINAWDVRPDLRSAIKEKLQRDGKVLFWLYAAGLFDAGRESLERAREITGIALKPQPFYSKAGTTLLNRKHPLAQAFPDHTVVAESKLEPSYFAIPEQAMVLGEYTQSGLPSFVVKNINEGPEETHWTSVFLGEPLVNAALIRGLAQMAGAHVWNFQEDVVHVRAPFLSVHCSGEGMRSIALPDKSEAFNLVLNQWAPTEAGSLKFYAVDGSTHVFLTGSRGDIEHLLGEGPNSFLEMAEYPVAQETERVRSQQFDIPIMKLGDWMGSGDSDEVADEWFLRAPTVQEIVEQAKESSDKIGQRRRSRRGRSGDEPNFSQGSAPTPRSIEDMEQNVMFRKRD